MDVPLKIMKISYANTTQKTMNNDKFLEYTKEKIQMRDMIATEIKYNEYLNKLKWFAHINRCRHEDKLLNKGATIFGTDTTFILGDWSKGNCIKYISTPNKKMKKLLMKRFDVLMIDEYKTSKLYYKNETEGDNQKVIRKELQVKLHSVLTFKMGNNNFTAKTNIFINFTARIIILQQLGHGK